MNFNHNRHIKIAYKLSFPIKIFSHRLVKYIYIYILLNLEKHSQNKKKNQTGNIKRNK